MTKILTAAEKAAKLAKFLEKHGGGAGLNMMGASGAGVVSKGRASGRPSPAATGGMPAGLVKAQAAMAGLKREAAHAEMTAKLSRMRTIAAGIKF